MNDTALVVMSGGQDSVTCLGVALTNHKQVFAISFNYGQRHEVELEQAAIICDSEGVDIQFVDMSFLGEMVTSALTGEGSVSEKHPANSSLPASFVPNRNALFLTIAHAYAQEIGAGTIYTGVCQTDYSGYPDCRENFVVQLQAALNTGYLTDIVIKTPLMFKTKAETFALAEQHDFLDVVLEYSHTCYEGNRETRHDWGYGCGVCPACLLREKGYNEFIESKAVEGKEA